MSEALLITHQPRAIIIICMVCLYAVIAPFTCLPCDTRRINFANDLVADPSDSVLVAAKSEALHRRLAGLSLQSPSQWHLWLHYSQCARSSKSHHCRTIIPRGRRCRTQVSFQPDPRPAEVESFPIPPLPVCLSTPACAFVSSIISNLSAVYCRSLIIFDVNASGADVVGIRFGIFTDHRRDINERTAI